jgi:hypothetical protein
MAALLHFEHRLLSGGSCAGVARFQRLAGEDSMAVHKAFGVAGAIVAAGTLAAFGPVSAAPQNPTPQVPQLRALDACRAVTDNAQRLACFDSAAAAFVNATRTGDLNVVDRGQLRQARRSLFGFSMPKLPFFAGDRSAEEDQPTLDTKVTSVRALENGRFRVGIADGQAVWETTETFLNFGPPRVGEAVSIRRGPLGSYFMRFGSQRGIRGRRVG